MIRRQVAGAAARGFPFYVYTLADATSVFYVGKGKGDRVLCHGRRGYTHNARKVLRMRSAVQRTIVAFFCDERAAFAHEGALIAEHGRTLTNVARVSPVDPRAAAIAHAREMLARIADLAEWRLPPSFSFPFAGCADVLELHAKTVAALRQEIEMPAPSSITVRADGRAQPAWGA